MAAVLRLLSFAVFYFGSVLAGQHGLIDPYDSPNIDRWAWYAAQHFQSGTWVDLRNEHLEGSWDVGFTYLVSLQYLIVGHHPEVARATNCLIAAVSAPAVYVAAKQTSLGEKVAARAGWLVACWPLSLYWSGYDLLKDPLVWLFLAIALLALAARTWPARAGLGAIAAGGAHLVRNYMGPVLAVLLLLAAILKRDWRGLTATAAALVIVQGALLAAGFPPVWSLSPYLSTAQRPSAGCASYLVTPAQPAALVDGLIGAAGSQCVAPPSRDLKTLATRLVTGLPVELLGPRLALKDIVHPTLDSGMFPGLVVWIVLIPFTALGLWRALRKGDATLWSLALFAIAIWALLALLYAGQGFRQREMAFPATLMFTSLGLERPWPRRWWWAYAIYWVVGLTALLFRELRLA